MRPPVRASASVGKNGAPGGIVKTRGSGDDINPQGMRAIRASGMRLRATTARQINKERDLRETGFHFR
jgi:hypothetical protein